MNKNIAMSLDRADELMVDLKKEYDLSLKNHDVSPRATHFTHEVCERLRSVLDRLARLYWEKHVSPDLTPEDRSKATVYFPITSNQNAFDSVLGRWRWKTVKANHNALENYLLSLQPFMTSANLWMSILNDLAVASKHIDLIPQKRVEEKRITVVGSGGSVSWGPGVTFGNGVSIMGAPVDPLTQRIKPTPGVNEKIEIWVSFLIGDYNVNAAGFCADACQQVRVIAEQMTHNFSM